MRTNPCAEHPKSAEQRGQTFGCVQMVQMPDGSALIAFSALFHVADEARASELRAGLCQLTTAVRRLCAERRIAPEDVGLAPESSAR